MQVQPPSSEAAHRSDNSWLWKWIIVALLLGGVLLGLRNVVLTQNRKAATSEALDNARSLSFSLFEFEHEYGRFPDASTITSVKERMESSLPFGIKSSNDFFRQLIASGIVQSESLFFVEIAGTKKPDNRIDGSHALEKGECGFSYIAGISTKDKNKPLLVTPLVPGTHRFDPIPFNGNACVIFANGTARVLPINENGDAIDHDGRSILDPTNPIWEGKPPVIAWPDF